MEEENKNIVQPNSDSQDNNLDKQQVTGQTNNASNYTKYMQKKIARVKKKALQYGVTIPDLKYELTAPDRPRTIFSIIGYIMIALGVALLVGTYIWLATSGLLKAFLELISGAKQTLDPDVALKTFGFSGFASVGTVFICIVIAILMIIPICICFAFVVLGIKNINLTYASKQEMAVGYEVTSYIRCLILIIGLSILALVLVVVEGGRGGLLIMSAIVVSVVIAICVLLLAILLKIRKKEKVWFDALPDDQKQDFLNQNKMLKQYSARKSITRTTNLGGW